MTRMSRWLVLIFLCAPCLAQEIDDVTIPRKTEVFIKLQRGLNTKTAKPGDRFSAQVEVPLTHNDAIIVPVDSYIIGFVDYAKRAGRLKGKAQLLLRFDTVILPNGITRNIRAVVQSAEGAQMDPQSEEGQLKSSGSQTSEVLVAATKGAVGGTITGATIGIFQGGVGKGAGIGALVGAGAGAIVSLLDRGEEVALPAGTSLTIQLEDETRFVKPGAVTESKAMPLPGTP